MAAQEVAPASRDRPRTHHASPPGTPESTTPADRRPQPSWRASPRAPATVRASSVWRFRTLRIIASAGPGRLASTKPPDIRDTHGPFSIPHKPELSEKFSRATSRILPVGGRRPALVGRRTGAVCRGDLGLGQPCGTATHHTRLPQPGSGSAVRPRPRHDPRSGCTGLWFSTTRAAPGFHVVAIGTCTGPDSRMAPWLVRPPEPAP